jgi:hypothetical protein
MSMERLKILEMIQEGKISANEGMELLNALNEPEKELKQNEKVETKGRFLHVKVSGDTNNFKKVDVNIPIGLIRATSKFITFGMGMIPKEARIEMESRGIDLSQLDFDELIQAIDQGVANGKLVDVDVDDPREGRIKVEVYVD